MPTSSSPKPADSELDIASEKFDPLRALYAPGYRISEKKPKVIYQNLAAFESALKRFGVMNLNKRNVPTVKQTIPKDDVGGSSTASAVPSTSNQRPIISEETQQRRFQPHQMPIKGSARKVKDMHNIFTYLDGVSGPMIALKQSMKEQRRVRVLVRNEHGIRGSLEGSLIWFDKFWNLWLRNVDEVWQRRKYKYGENKVCGEPQDCSLRLHELGIELPRQQVRSINRKTVEIRRQLPQLFVRGEQVALVILPENVAPNKTDM